SIDFHDDIVKSVQQHTLVTFIRSYEATFRGQTDMKVSVVKAYTLDEQLSGTDNQEKDEKQSQNEKTGLGMEKTVKDKAKSKPESQSNQKVNWSKSKSTQVTTNPKVNM
ncbi:hypothetical protein Tco_1129455, partial [Tanacetum coccineum]